MPEFASPVNGIFICMTCKSSHEKLLLKNTQCSYPGTNSETSNPRSLFLSSWDAEDLTLMSFGGNERLKIFLSQYGLDTCDLKTKYNSQACEFYRKKVSFPPLLTTAKFYSQWMALSRLGSYVRRREEASLDQVDRCFSYCRFT